MENIRVLCGENLLKMLAAIELSQEKRHLLTGAHIIFVCKMSHVKIEAKLIVVQQF